MARQLRRPTKEMMLAVNAAIMGNKKKVTQLVNEHRLSRKELEARLEIRDGEKYKLRRTQQRPNRTSKAQPVTTTNVVRNDVLRIIDRRTDAVTLVSLKTRVEELLAQKRKAEVNKVEKAMAEVEVLRKKYEDAKAVLGM